MRWRNLFDTQRDPDAEGGLLRPRLHPHVIWQRCFDDRALRSSHELGPVPVRRDGVPPCGTFGTPTNTRCATGLAASHGPIGPCRWQVSSVRLTTWGKSGRRDLFWLVHRSHQGEIRATRTSTGEVRPRPSDKLNSLTGLRWVAAFAVFAYHTAYVTSGPVHSLTAGLFGHGRAGVSLFFILSGFVLTSSARSDDNTARIWRRRAAKILPNYLVAWTLTAVLFVLTATVATKEAAFSGLGMVQAWVPSPGIYWGWNSVAWTLSCEVFFYAIFPMVLPLLASRGLRARWYLVVAFPTTTIGLGIASNWLTRADPNLLYAHMNLFAWFVYICPISRAPEFLFGIVLALMVRDQQLQRVPVLGAAIVVMCACAASYTNHHFTTLTAFMVVPFGVLIVALAQADLAGSRSALRIPSMVTLGEWSYAFYLVSFVILDSVARSGFSPMWNGLEIVALSFTLAVACAALLFTLVERPCQRRFGAARQRISHSHLLGADFKSRISGPSPSVSSSIGFQRLAPYARTECHPRHDGNRPLAGAVEWDPSAEIPVGHLAARRTEARQSLNRRHEPPGGLPNRHSSDGLADLRVADKHMSNPETFGADDK